jgi:tetratricopeptide (TPR) repeat protein
MVAFLLVMVASLTLRGVVRALPGRYAYYLPEPLQDLRHVEHSGVLPTPDSTPMVPLLMTPSATPISLPTPTLTPTPMPVEDIPQKTEAVAPTATPSPLPSPTPTAVSALPNACLLDGVRAERQGWNNCGPTTLAMALSFWGHPETQTEIAPALKPDPEDKNVGPYEMADYARGLGFGALVRVGGDVELLRKLVANDFPVVVETWYVDEDDEQMGHYRLIVGYDDAVQRFTTFDSLHTPEVILSYAELDELWRAFNRLFLVIYAPEQEAALTEVLGPYMDAEYAVEQALATAQTEVTNPPETCVAYVQCSDAQTFAWFNMGSSLTALGDYQGAAAAFDQARALGLPFRMIWYQFGPYEAYYAVGRYKDVITLADHTLRIADNLEESYYWRGKARVALGDLAGAREDFETALHYHAGWSPAQQALGALAP